MLGMLNVSCNEQVATATPHRRGRKQRLAPTAKPWVAMPSCPDQTPGCDSADWIEFGRRPAAALAATVRIGMVVMLPADYASSDTAEVVHMTADRCTVRTERGEVVSLQWAEVILTHVRPDPRQISRR